MRTNLYRLLAMALIATGCATQVPVKLPVTKPIPTTPIQVTPKKVYKTPSYALPANASKDFSEAVELIVKYANSDEFMDYVKGKRTYFSHVNGKTAAEVIKEFRDQLNQADVIGIVLYTPWYRSKAVGGWDGTKINENTQFVMTGIERAGHLLHETSHKYGWVHSGNKTYKFDNVNSFPYAIGYDFQDFLKLKTSNQLAGD